MKILIVKLSAIGDVVQTLPALEAIKKTYPDSEITWVVEEAAAGILEGHPAITRLLISRRRAWLAMLTGISTVGHGVRSIISFIRELRSIRYDIAVDFQGLLKSGVIIGLARADRKIGFNRTRELSYLFLNERLPAYDKEKHALERYLDVARYLGAKEPSSSCILPIAREISAITERLEKTVGARHALPLLVVINPMARWVTKLWPERNFSELADRLIQEKGAVVIFTGSPSDRRITGKIITQMREQAHNWAGETSLKELAALAALADIFITTDTGPMHLAAAAGGKVLALFGPTAPWRTGPYGERHQVIRTGIGCSPCFQRSCKVNVVCMAGITVDKVMRTIESLF
jgi:heptosyltransferase I